MYRNENVHVNGDTENILQVFKTNRCIAYVETHCEILMLFTKLS